MRLQTALRYANEVAARVRAAGGLVATPLCDREAARISRIWVFGSTVKGSQTPNDLDLLIEMRPAGRWRNWRESRVDRRHYRSYGIKRAPSCRDAALIWLTKGMRKVSRHLSDVEGVEIDVKVMIYPRNDLPAYMTLLGGAT